MAQSGDNKARRLHIVDPALDSPTLSKVEQFAVKVQEYRRLGGKSQKELAEALALHPKVLSRKLSSNSDASLTHPEVKQLIKTLAAWRAILTQTEAIELLELAGLHPGSFEEAEWQAPPLSRLEKSPAATPTITLLRNDPPRSNHNLPAALTSFVGRQASVTRLCQMLGQGNTRLISLVGMGGAGKTRLALEVAKCTIDQFEHGVWFVPLAGVSEPTLLIATIAQILALEVKDRISVLEQLKSYLQPRQLLLVLDNFEQLQDVAAQVSELLETAAGLKILVTSRSILHLYGEYEFRVAPLKLPDLATPALERTSNPAEAVQLFVERAQAANPDFELTPDNSFAVAQVCVQLEGLPLAIELAAARIRSFELSVLLAQLKQARLPLLTNGPRNLPPRHQTLHNALEWSYNLLPPDEQRWLINLSVFRSGWTASAAQAVCTPTSQSDFETFEKLNALIEKSLIQIAASNQQQQPRYIMLETVREFALQKLIDSGSHTRCQASHAEYYVELAKQADLALQGPQQGHWLNILDSEINNIWAALSWATTPLSEITIENPPVLSYEQTRKPGQSPIEPVLLGLELASALGEYWSMRGLWSEGSGYLELLLNQQLQMYPTSPLRAKALNAISHLAILQSNYDVARQYAQQSLALGQTLNERVEIAYAHANLGEVALNQGDYALAQIELQASLVLFRQLENPSGIANVLSKLGLAYRYSGNFQAAQKYSQEGLEVYRQYDDKQGVAYSLTQLGHVASLQREIGEAQRYYKLGLALYRELDIRQGAAGVLAGLGALAVYEADYAAGTHYFQEVLVLYREAGYKIGIAAILNNLGNQALYQGHDAVAQQFFEEALTLSREIGDKQGMVLGLYRLGSVWVSQNSLEAAHQCYQQSLELAREIGDEQTVPKALRGLGDLALLEGQLETAKKYCDESLTLARASGGKFALARTLLSEVLVAVAYQRLPEATQLLQESLGLIEPMHDKHLLVQMLAVEVIFSAAQAERAAQTVQLKQSLAGLMSKFKLVLEPPIRQAYNTILGYEYS